MTDTELAESAALERIRLELSTSWLVRKVRDSGSALGMVSSTCWMSLTASSVGWSSKRKLPSLERTRTIMLKVQR